MLILLKQPILSNLMLPSHGPAPSRRKLFVVCQEWGVFNRYCVSERMCALLFKPFKALDFGKTKESKSLRWVLLLFKIP